MCVPDRGIFRPQILLLLAHVLLIGCEVSLEDVAPGAYVWKGEKWVEYIYLHSNGTYDHHLQQDGVIFHEQTGNYKFDKDGFIVLWHFHVIEDIDKDGHYEHTSTDMMFYTKGKSLYVPLDADAGRIRIFIREVRSRKRSDPSRRLPHPS